MGSSKERGKPMEPRDAIRAAYGTSRNMMTPKVNGYGVIATGPSGALVYERSSGTGINREPIYGVTVVRVRADETTNPVHEMSCMFWSSADATAYVRRLRRRVRRLGARLTGAAS
jgi:hypothetical protein